MGYIHYLCEINARDELLEELGDKDMVDGFLEAHREIRKQKDNKAYDGLNDIVSKSIEKVKEDIPKAREESREGNSLFSDIMALSSQKPN